MSRFIKGQWYHSKATKRYFQCVCSDTGCVRMRQAGGTGRTVIEILYSKQIFDTLIPASLIPDFSKAKEGDECWLYGIGETGIDSIGDDYVTVFDDENKYVFDKSGYLYAIDEYIGGAYIRSVSCGFEESPMLFNSFAQFQAYWAEQALEMAQRKENIHGSK